MASWRAPARCASPRFAPPSRRLDITWWDTGVIQFDSVNGDLGGTQALQNLSLTLHKPGLVGVTGRQGCGSSTLLRLLGGLIFPAQGEVRVLGMEPRLRKPQFLAQISMVSPGMATEALHAWSWARALAPFYPGFSRDDFDEYLSIFELPARRLMCDLAKSQQQAIALAFALATHTPVLLLDEPTAALERVGRTRLASVLRRPEHRHRWVIMGCHQTADLEALLDQLIVLESGRLSLQASMPQLRRALRMQWSRDPHAGEPIHEELVNGRPLYLVRNADSQPGGIKVDLLVRALLRNRAGVLAALAPNETGCVASSAKGLR